MQHFTAIIVGLPPCITVQLGVQGWPRKYEQFSNKRHIELKLAKDIQFIHTQ